MLRKLVINGKYLVQFYSFLEVNAVVVVVLLIIHMCIASLVTECLRSGLIQKVESTYIQKKKKKKKKCCPQTWNTSLTYMHIEVLLTFLDKENVWQKLLKFLFLRKLIIHITNFIILSFEIWHFTYLNYTPLDFRNRPLHFQFKNTF